MSYLTFGLLIFTLELLEIYGITHEKIHKEFHSHPFYSYAI